MLIIYEEIVYFSRLPGGGGDFGLHIFILIEILYFLLPSGCLLLFNFNFLHHYVRLLTLFKPSSSYSNHFEWSASSPKVFWENLLKQQGFDSTTSLYVSIHALAVHYNFKENCVSTFALLCTWCLLSSIISVFSITLQWAFVWGWSFQFYFLLFQPSNMSGIIRSHTSTLNLHSHVLHRWNVYVTQLKRSQISQSLLVHSKTYTQAINDR